MPIRVGMTGTVVPLSQSFGHLVEHIDFKAREFQAADPVTSVGTEKHALPGEYRGRGNDHGPKDIPIEVDADNFDNKELGKAVPRASPRACPKGFMTWAPTVAMSALASTTIRRSSP